MHACYTKKILVVLLAYALFSPILPTQGSVVDELTTINMERPVYFLAPDGSSVLVESGSYEVERAQEWIRLIPDERRNAWLIEATSTTHEEIITSPLAISLPGEEGESVDIHHVVLLLPDGQSLDAVGTYSGIRTRGFFKKVASRPRIRKAVQGVRSKVQTTAQNVVQAIPKILPPDFIKAAQVLGPDFVPLFQCLKTARKANVGALVQQIKNNPKDFVRLMIQNILFLLRSEWSG